MKESREISDLNTSFECFFRLSPDGAWKGCGPFVLYRELLLATQIFLTSPQVFSFLSFTSKFFLNLPRPLPHYTLYPTPKTPSGCLTGATEHRVLRWSNRITSRWVSVASAKHPKTPAEHPKGCSAQCLRTLNRRKQKQKHTCVSSSHSQSIFHDLDSRL